MRREKLNVYWGNNFWIRDKDGLIRPTDKLTRGHKRWINYRHPHVENTSRLRDKGHAESFLRCAFANQIVDDIILQHSHCLTIEKPICYLTCGGTASGKTSAVDQFLKNRSEFYPINFLRIDYDALKHRLPEYEHMLSLKIKNAAEFVQAESGKIAGKLFEKAVRRKMNIIYEKTISTADQTLNEIRDLKKRDYLVILLATHAKVEVGLKRAEDRYLKNGRFVRPEIILDTYSKVHKSLKVLKDAVDAVVLYDNNGSSLELMYLAEDKIGKVIDKALYDEYLNTVGQEYRLDKV